MTKNKATEVRSTEDLVAAFAAAAAEAEKTRRRELEEEEGLDNIIKSSDWDRVREWFVAHPPSPQPSSDAGSTRVLSMQRRHRRGHRLHQLCSIGSCPSSLIDLVASQYPDAVSEPDFSRYGDTPLHVACRNSQTSTDKVRVLLQHLRRICDVQGENPSCEAILVRNTFGGTALHSAANHNAVIDVLEMLVNCNPSILKVKTTRDGVHAVSALWSSYIQTIPGYMSVSKILEGGDVGGGIVEDGVGGHFERFWKKVEFLASEYYFLTSCGGGSSDAAAGAADDADGVDPTLRREDCVLHGLLMCNVAINMYRVALRRPNSRKMAATADRRDGNLALHRLVRDRPFRLKERDAIVETVRAYPGAVRVGNGDGDAPLAVAIRNKVPYTNGVDAIVGADPDSTLRCRDAETGLYPFQLAAAVGGKVALETTYRLLRTLPDLLRG